MHAVLHDSVYRNSARRYVKCRRSRVRESTLVRRNVEWLGHRVSCTGFSDAIARTDSRAFSRFHIAKCRHRILLFPGLFAMGDVKASDIVPLTIEVRRLTHLE